MTGFSLGMTYTARCCATYSRNASFHHLPLPSLLRWDAFSSATSEWEERRRLTAFVVEHKLLGLLPLDAEDEGLDPVGLTLTLADIHAYFESLVQTREIAEACKLLEQSPSSRRDA